MSHSYTLGWFAWLIVPSLLLVSCSGEPVSPPFSPVSILTASVRANPHNVVSAIATVRTAGAATALAEYSTDSVNWARTPESTIADDTVEIPVLGLAADTRHLIRVVAISASRDTIRSAPMALHTDPLPDDLPAITIITTNNPTPGYVLFGGTSSASLASYYALILDNAGTVRWYRRFPKPVLDVQKQPGGRYTAHSTLDAQPGRFFELDNLGNVTGEFSAESTTRTGVHELRLTSDGHLLFGIEERSMDLTHLGGKADARVTGQIVEYHRNGQLPFTWSTFDHLLVEDATPDVDLTGAEVNPWHMNAIEIDSDGNLLVSLRNTDQVVKIDAQTGEVIWRLGGKRNQFTFIGDEFNGFSHQHGIRRLANGNILLFDNGNLHPRQVSRAVEYRIDEEARRAELVWEYRSSPAIYAFAMGFAQRLANGHTVVSYGTTQRIIETDMSGTTRWEMTIDTPGYFAYRAFRIESLY